MSERPLTPLMVTFLEAIRREGETSTSNLGHYIKAPSGGTSNPGTRAAASVLRAMKARGLVRDRFVYGNNFGRTLWSLR